MSFVFHKTHTIHSRNVNHNHCNLKSYFRLIIMNSKLLVLFFLLTLSTSKAQSNRYLTKLDSTIGYIDKTGKIKIPFLYTSGRQFSEGLASVTIGTKSGYIDTVGSLIIPFKFDKAFEFSDASAIIEINGKEGLINNKGDYIIKPEYERIYYKNQGYVGVKKNDFWAFYDTKGNQITSFIYPSIGEFSEGLAPVRSLTTFNYGFIDTTGKMVIPPTLEQTYSGFQNGFAAVIDSTKKACYIDSTGKNLFNKYFYSVESYNQGLAFVKESYDKGYFIKAKGERLNQNNYKNSWGFTEGFCGVSTDTSYLVIDTLGNELFESKNIELRFYINNFGFFCDHSESIITWGIMDKNQNIISKERFVKAFYLYDLELIEVYIGDPSKFYAYGKRKYLSIEGKQISK
jgi:hypothetical protein